MRESVKILFTKQLTFYGKRNINVRARFWSGCFREGDTIDHETLVALDLF